MITKILDNFVLWGRVFSLFVCFLFVVVVFFGGVIEHLKAGQVRWITLITRNHLLPEKSILFCSRKSLCNYVTCNLIILKQNPKIKLDPTQRKPESETKSNYMESGFSEVIERWSSSFPGRDSVLVLQGLARLRFIWVLALCFNRLTKDLGYLVVEGQVNVYHPKRENAWSLRVTETEIPSGCVGQWVECFLSL